MPRGDGTGPAGMGPMTGRGAGFCDSFATPDYMNPRINNRMGYGRGQGIRRMFYFNGVPTRTKYNYPVNQRIYTNVMDKK